MNHTRPIATLLLALAGALLPAMLGAQVFENSEPGAAWSGTEYYIAFPQAVDRLGDPRPKYMGVLISSRFATEGQIVVPGGLPIPFSLRPGKDTLIELPRALELTQDESEEVNSKGVRITSRAPVSVYVLNSRYQSNGGYAALPLSHWGKHYQALTLPNQVGGNVSEILVIAAYDNTIVTIRPNATTWRHSAGQEVTKYLNRGETFSMVAYPGETGVADMSATEVTSTLPVAVIAAHVRTSITIGRPYSHLDQAAQQAVMMLPDVAWGKSYLTIPMRPSGDRFRLMAASGGTRVTLTHYPAGGAEEKLEVSLGRGEYIDIGSINGHPITGPAYWSAGGDPFMLMQLRTSGPYGDPKDAPAMLSAVAIDQMAARSIFSAPRQFSFADQAEFTNSLTLIARGPVNAAPNDPANPLRSIRLDGRPLHEIAPAILTQRIGATGFYHVTLPVAPGGHTIVSDPAYPFTGIITGDNGKIARDAYMATLPFWIPEIAADVAAPYLLQRQEPSKGVVGVLISDSTAGYFSGVDDVRIASTSSGWTRVGFDRRSADNPASATFRATTDPSGPLDLELVDRDGNMTVIRQHEGVCFKTATADRTAIRIDGNQGSGSFLQTVTLTTNRCGDAASVRFISIANGTATDRLTLTTDRGIAPFQIPAGEKAEITLTAQSGTPVGTYVTALRITIDDSTMIIPVELVVGTSSVPPDHVTSEITGFYPNPFTGSTTLRLMHPLDRDASVTISDRLGRVVRILDGEQLQNRSEITWNGDDASGRALPGGLYLVTVDRHGARSARAVTLVR